MLFPNRTHSLIRRVVRDSTALADHDDDQLRAIADDLRWRARCGTAPANLTQTAFALVRSATSRALGFSHHDEQLLGGIIMSRGGIAEMQTGEGKTITALLPSFLWSLFGRGTHVITSNDYLAGRDAELAQAVLGRLGTSIGRILPGMERPDRKLAYDADITYGTVKEFGFDFLRDRIRVGASRLRLSGNASVGFDQRGHFFVLVDEADSVLIDEARTPLVIAQRAPHDDESRELLRWCLRFAESLAPDREYRFEPSTRSATLTRQGDQRLWTAHRPPILRDLPHTRVAATVERTIAARDGYARDRDYVIEDGEVQIVDESTGRILHGRKWQAGIHHAIELREGEAITDRNRETGRITVQRFLQHYENICGMTGTAWSVRRELRDVFGTRVRPIPTHRPSRRARHATRIFRTDDAKLDAIAESTRRFIAAGRPVLVGTPTVADSERVATRLTNAGIADLAILHACQDADEAEIVARAGAPGRVTVATNMAGRGTDIHVDDDARQAGGLHVILTSMHGSSRIDRQLIGRTGRQGDPGSYQLFLALEDELLAALPSASLRAIRALTARTGQPELPRRYLKYFRRAQQAIEHLHARQRVELLNHEQEHERASQALGLNPYLEFFDRDTVT